MFFLMNLILFAVVITVVILATIFISKKLNTGELKNDNLFTKFLKVIFDLITFLIPACIISALFVIPLFSTITVVLHDSPNGENMLEQIYNYIQTTGGVLGLGIGLVLGFLLTYVIRNTAHLNRIEEKIAEIQEKQIKE